jgi:hypothetical protein
VSIPDLFEPLVGLPTWGVSNFHGSMFMIEFGQPRLVLEEQKALPLHLENGPHRAPMRHTAAVGDWTLEILYCEWELQLGEEVLAHCETPEPFMARALRFLQGQVLLGVIADEANARTSFRFDLNGTLTTRPASAPYRHEAELWTLLAPGKAWSLCEDGILRTGE